MECSSLCSSVLNHEVGGLSSLNWIIPRVMIIIVKQGKDENRKMMFLITHIAAAFLPLWMIHGD